MALIDDLVSYWSLGEASGTRFDAHGTNDLSDNGSVSSVTGKVGSAANFPAGGTRYLSGTLASSLPEQFAVSFWVNPVSLKQNGGMITISADASNYIEYTDHGGFGETFLTEVAGVSDYGWRPGTLVAGQWSHFVINVQGPLLSDISLWENGVEITNSRTANLPTGLDTVWIGESRNSPGRYWDGQIDEVGVWSRALSSSEISDLYNSGSGRDYSYIQSTGGTPSTGAARRLINSGLVGSSLINGGLVA